MTTLVLCDIQYEYDMNWSKNYLSKVFKEMHDKKYSDVIIFFNSESVGMSTEREYKEWLFVQMLDYDTYFPVDADFEEIDDFINSLKFNGKGYGNLRYLIDQDVDTDLLLLMLKCIKNENKSSFEDLTKEQIIKCISAINDINTFNNFNEKILNALMSTGEYFGFDVDVQYELDRFNKDETYCLIGGFRWQCLYELELQMLAYDLNVEIIDDLTF